VFHFGSLYRVISSVFVVNCKNSFETVRIPKLRIQNLFHS
jgi:hypothetical protein